jgi:hypothetical protein
MNRFKYILILLAIIIVLMLLMGCSPKYYSKDTRKCPGPQLTIKRHKSVKRYMFWHPIKKNKLMIEQKREPRWKPKNYK